MKQCKFVKRNFGSCEEYLITFNKVFLHKIEIVTKLYALLRIRNCKFCFHFRCEMSSSIMPLSFRLISMRQLPNKGHFPTSPLPGILTQPVMCANAKKEYILFFLEWYFDISSHIFPKTHNNSPIYDECQTQ